LQQILKRHKSKGKAHPRTRREDPEGECTCNSTLSLTSALVGGGRSTPRPGRLTVGKESRYPLCKRLGGPQGRSGQMRKSSPLKFSVSCIGILSAVHIVRLLPRFTSKLSA
jgi:hypothetical protein